MGYQFDRFVNLHWVGFMSCPGIAAELDQSVIVRKDLSKAFGLIDTGDLACNDASFKRDACRI
jgi:hypothetical protein